MPSLVIHSNSDKISLKLESTSQSLCPYLKHCSDASDEFSCKIDWIDVNVKSDLAGEPRHLVFTYKMQIKAQHSFPEPKLTYSDCFQRDSFHID